MALNPPKHPKKDIHSFGNTEISSPSTEENVFAFDVYDPELRRLVLEVFQRHGLALDPAATRAARRPSPARQLVAPRICGQLRRGEGARGGNGWGWMVVWNGLDGLDGLDMFGRVRQCLGGWKGCLDWFMA